MLGYIGIVSSTKSIEHRAIAGRLRRHVEQQMPRWSLVFGSDELSVYCHPSYSEHDDTYLLTRNRGVVLGRLFGSSTIAGRNRALVTLSDQLSDAIHDTRAKHLIDACWGRYVAFVLHRDGTVHVLRDVTGALPCLVTKYSGVTLVCSKIGDCAALGLLNPDVNWAHIAGYLSFGHMVTRHSGLNSVLQVHAGECFTFGPTGQRSTFYWTPSEVATRRTLDCANEAKHELRRTIESCVATWASSYSSILHELSGGLDSSVVLACLADSDYRTNVACETHFTHDVAGDERRFARLAAHAASIKLVERQITSSGRSLAEMFSPEKVASPTSMRFIPDTQVGRDCVTGDRQVDAVFSGQGGDHLFQSVRTSQIAAEYLSHHGLGRGLWSVTKDTARFTGRPVWSVAWTAFVSGLLHVGDDPYSAHKPSPLLSDSARASLDLRIVRHPWVDGTDCLPPCKRRQIFDIVDTQNFYRTSRGSSDVVHPLISQPIIELCLQIPSYVLTYGGIGRALLRDAFSGSVPHEILRRTTKGTTTAYFVGLLSANASQIRDMLLEGNLARAGVIDRRKVESALSHASLARNPNMLFTVLDAFRAELWSRSWSSAVSRAERELAQP